MFTLTGFKRFSLFILLSLLASCEKETKIEFKEMVLSKNGNDFIRAKEGVKLYAYNDGSGYAIGYGNTYYEDGTKVRAGDRITQERANRLFEFIAAEFARKVSNLVYSNVNQNQFDALVSYTYNRGVGAFSKSRLLQMINVNPDNEAIAGQFVIEWGSNYTYKNGLIKRRQAEAALYVSSVSSSQGFQGVFNSEYALILLIIVILLASRYSRRKTKLKEI
jgi:lysozyme